MQNSAGEPAPGLRAAWDQAATRIDRLDARLLLQAATGCDHATLIAHPNAPITSAAWKEFQTWVARRAAGVPLAYLDGWTEFYGLHLRINPSVLIPRQETELLVELGLQRCAKLGNTGNERLSLLDLGTGSGAIAIALSKKYPEMQCTGVDNSAAALALARANADRYKLNIRWLLSDWYTSLAGERFHLIVANPPYIAAGDPYLQADGLPHEPQQALVAEENGLAALRYIISSAPQYLHPSGYLLFEHGFDQAEACRATLSAAGFSAINSHKDLSGNWRVTVGRLCTTDSS